MDDVYSKMSLEEISWNMETPPELLVELVESGKVKPCRVVDLGCGAGNYAIYLAERGFEVTGVDISPKAIEIAKNIAKKRNLTCNFLVVDVVEGLNKLGKNWDFAYDWGMLHHILPEQRQKYVRNVHQILSPKGRYLSVCFSEKDVGFESSEKIRTTRIGSVLYFSSEDELRELFKPYFQIIEMKTVDIDGKFQSHTFNYFFMERK
jgi:cyclopropane fatty-acyl-phospholipid synthase-like methyltransferase